MDATKKPLRIPPSFGVYAEEHGIFDMYKRLLCQLIIDKPVEPLQYLIDWLKRDNSNISKIAVIGPPASGKSGISKVMSKTINSVHITSDVLLDDELSDAANEAKKLISTSQAVTDKLWVQMIEERLKRKDCLRRGFVLEGFPQNREQAIMLQANGLMLKHLVVLDAPNTVLVERQAGKRIDPTTGDVYHTTFDWPQDSTVQARLLVPEGISETETRDRLNEYSRNIDGVLATYPHIHKLINADQPKADVLAQTYNFINTQLRSEAPHTPRIVLIGATGSGKSCIAQRLATKYKIVDVSCGTLLKEQVANNTKMGEALREFVSGGERVPNSLVTKVVADRLMQLDASSRGWVLHGYPLTRDQAEGLFDAGLQPNRIYFFDIPDDCVIERLCYRITDPISGERYHTLYNPPRSNDVKQRCLQNYKDSQNNVRQLLNEYHSYAEELTDYYSEEGALRINADQDPQTVFEYVESTLVNPLPGHLGQKDY
uniref:Radial spoke protein AK58 n=1 Tax=Ciona intestinalis TaxID=7719 RepID=C4B8W9_CIOIN|nr:radial spoke protein AK58 [Ciona intestinalis]BAH59278.1 radial spoke protein AK58 [Ciona intestinalis]|eukprot:NP_001155275.1 radial spoke protein AK58 [Ciona intestinalis]